MRRLHQWAAAWIGLAVSWQAAAQNSETVEDYLPRIRQALPDQPQVKPVRPRKLLICTRTLGFRHSSIPVGVAALTELGRKTGAFEVVHSESRDAFEQSSLDGVDAVCFLNSTGEIFTATDAERAEANCTTPTGQREARLKQNLLAFVAGGKGLIGIHSATDMFYQWPEYGELIGGYFDGHPWNEPVVIRNEEPAHPLNLGLGGKALEIHDEIYQMKAPYRRERTRVLLSLDTSRTDMKKPGIHRSDGDFAVSWIRPFGEGRVFYCSLGHREEVFGDARVIKHYLAGIQYALGDLSLQADQARPSLKDGRPVTSAPAASRPERP